ncbi:TPA: XRE family transcriptional regulator [Yersinia enterocolitica]|uniref:XRE family transcriptional regulator n=1 Tax=Yersinia TaxID=629 RepID=UPI0005DE9B49|nr:MULTISPECIES: helix-turn-helix transcriptional regulator [Yersinia]EKN3339943.1 helix-turn-helix transcriptional regulator [Yersinia enterocolitica]ELW8173910.1 helix-turn-helix transcriptional regulator [Yersinia enterocolitica]MDN0129637.1 helix-turn-helix transcriptional regulator [Yersinia massiliensis]QKJ09757.1 helix-turn-helix transcriptional regulator [Yersinia massiliensis]CQH54879.1 RapGH repressor [Yersinia frederiksenii]
MSVGENIRRLRKARKMTILELATQIGGDVGNLSRLERGKQGYSDASLKRIAEALNVTVSDLFSNDETNDTVNAYSISAFQSGGRDNVYRVELLDFSASAGNGGQSRDVIEIIKSIEYDPEHAKVMFGNRPSTVVKLINVRGDSMSGTMESGDAIYVDISVNYFDGDGIYVFDFNGDTYVKRLQKIKNLLYVISDNPHYKEWYITPEEVDMFHVSGKVILSQSQSIRRHG